MTNKFSRYTEELHIEGLKLLLSKEDPYIHCPKNLIRKKLKIMEKIDFEIDSFVNVITSPSCNICKNFIEVYDGPYPSCPCHILEKREAIKRTWIKLEEVLDENDPFLNDERYNYDK